MAKRLEVHKLTLSANYSSHLAALMQALPRTDGPVLELGLGTFSTPYLHYACLLAGRKLVSYETDQGWFELFKDWQSELHDIRLVADWDKADFERVPSPLVNGGVWGVALVDHSPHERRVVEVARLAQHARIIVLHDSDEKWEPWARYSTVYPLFRYRTDWDGDYRKAVVLSNYVDLERFWE